jgi:prepilin-type processing-associated H-X9-DG protein
MRKRDAVVLAILVTFVVLNAGAFRMHSKVLMCTTNLQKIGQALPMYCESYDGKMPSMNLYVNYTDNKWHSENCERAHWAISQYQPGTGQAWSGLGCLFKAGLTPDGRTFYCPSAAGYMEEYASYCSPAPWGSNLQLQMPNSPGNGNLWLRITKGYIYWPQGNQNVASSYINPFDGKPLGYPNSSNGYSRYKIGYPAPPLLYSQLAPSKAMAVDSEPQQDDGTNYKVNGLFGDGHVRYQLVPRYNGLWICPYQASRPATAIPSQWYGDGMLWNDITLVSQYVYQLEP